MKHGCAVLAGGAGRRMGRINKAELSYKGSSFLEYICSEFERAGLRGYISAANYDQKIPAGWTVVRDVVTGSSGEFIGPVGGILSCLIEARRDGLDGLFFAPCDTPLFSADIVLKLLDVIESDPVCEAAIFRTADGRLQSTFGWYSINCISRLKEDVSRGNYKLSGSLDHLNTRSISAEEAGLDDRVFMNINHLEDYRELLQQETGCQEDII